MNGMKKLVLKIGAAALLFAVLPSCKKLLDIKSESSITEQVYFKSENDFEPNVTGIYTYLRSLVNNDFYGEQRSEELVNGPNSRLNSAVWGQNLSATNGALDYGGWYTAIGHCNLLLEKIKGFEFASNPDTKKRIIAETLGLRAWFYFHLVRIIGDTPLMLDAITTDDVPLLPRSPATEVMKRIQADIDEALTQLTSASNFSKTAFPSSKYRFSYAGLQALKADSKLWSAKVLGGGDADLNTAIAALAEVEASGVSLNTDFKDVIGKRASAGNSEVILSAFFLRDEGVSNYSLQTIAITSLVADPKILNRDSIPSAISPSFAQGGYLMSPKSKALFDNPNDKRIPYTFITERFATGPGTRTWVSKLPGTKYADDRFPDNDIIVYRLADILLMKAEAYAGLNNTTDAITYLNKVRSRAGTGNYSGATDKLSVERAILDERGRELYFENKRWYDLVRFHKGGTIDVYTYVPNLVGKTTPLFWPLAQSILAKNTNLKQTTGY
jgi:starch-binding outer membrane protein, SusD/RagB family